MAAKRQTKKKDAGQAGGRKGTTGKAETTKRKRAATEPPPQYGVLTEVAGDGEVWHYPVQMGSSVVHHTGHSGHSASPAAQVDGRAGPEFVYFNRVLPSGRLAQGAHAFMRFKTRIRAVRFIEEVVAAHHETLSYLLGMAQGQGTSGASGQGAGGA